MTKAEHLLHLARRAGAMIATAESCTGGKVAAAITDIAGSSAVFDRGFVTYSNAAKVAQLGVRESTLSAYGAVSEAVAIEMAEGALAHSQASLTVATTGIAGPGTSPKGGSASPLPGAADRPSAKPWNSAHGGAPGCGRRRRSTRSTC